MNTCESIFTYGLIVYCHPVPKHTTCFYYFVPTTSYVRLEVPKEVRESVLLGQTTMVHDLLTMIYGLTRREVKHVVE